MAGSSVAAGSSVVASASTADETTSACISIDKGLYLKARSITYDGGRLFSLGFNNSRCRLSNFGFFSGNGNSSRFGSRHY